MATVLAADANGWIQHGHLIGHADAAADLVDERKSDAIEPGIRLGGLCRQIRFGRCRRAARVSARHRGISSETSG